MNIGDKVTIVKKMIESSRIPKRWVTTDIEPTKAVYLGTGQRWDGDWKWEYAYDEEFPNDKRFWVNTKCYNVFVVQPVDKGGRYRLPIAVPVDGIMAENDG